MVEAAGWRRPSGRRRSGWRVVLVLCSILRRCAASCIAAGGRDFGRPHACVRAGASFDAGHVPWQIQAMSLVTCCVRKAGGCAWRQVSTEGGRCWVVSVQIEQCSVEGHGDVLSRPAGRCVQAFRVTVQGDYGLCCRAHGASACGCVASLPARNDRLRHAASPHLPPTSGQALCSTAAGVYKFIMPPSGIRNRVRVRGFFHESLRNCPLTRFWEP